MDRAVPRRRSVLSELVWDPISGSCVLQSSLTSTSPTTTAAPDEETSLPSSLSPSSSNTSAATTTTTSATTAGLEEPPAPNPTSSTSTQSRSASFPGTAEQEPGLTASQSRETPSSTPASRIAPSYSSTTSSSPTSATPASVSRRSSVGCNSTTILTTIRSNITNTINTEHSTTKASTSTSGNTHNSIFSASNRSSTTTTATTPSSKATTERIKNHHHRLSLPQLPLRQQEDHSKDKPTEEKKTKSQKQRLQEQQKQQQEQQQQQQQPPQEICPAKTETDFKLNPSISFETARNIFSGSLKENATPLPAGRRSSAPDSGLKVSVVSLIRKMSDSAHQGETTFRSHTENVQKLNKERIPFAVRGDGTRVANEQASRNSGDTQISQDGPCQGNSRFETGPKSETKGGVASLISKFQGQSQMEGTRRTSHDAQTSLGVADQTYRDYRGTKHQTVDTELTSIANVRVSECQRLAQEQRTFEKEMERDQSPRRKTFSYSRSPSLDFHKERPPSSAPSPNSHSPARASPNRSPHYSPIRRSPLNSVRGGEQMGEVGSREDSYGLEPAEIQALLIRRRSLRDRRAEVDSHGNVASESIEHEQLYQDHSKQGSLLTKSGYGYSRTEWLDTPSVSATEGIPASSLRYGKQSTFSVNERRRSDSGAATFERMSITEWSRKRAAEGGDRENKATLKEGKTLSPGRYYQDVSHKNADEFSDRQYNNAEYAREPSKHGTYRAGSTETADHQPSTTSAEAPIFSDSDSNLMAIVSTHDQSHNVSRSSSRDAPALPTEVNQSERIAKYKEDRRKQLAYIAAKCGVNLTNQSGLKADNSEQSDSSRKRSSVHTKNQHWNPRDLEMDNVSPKSIQISSRGKVSSSEMKDDQYKANWSKILREDKQAHSERGHQETESRPESPRRTGSFRSPPEYVQNTQDVYLQPVGGKCVPIQNPPSPERHRETVGNGVGQELMKRRESAPPPTKLFWEREVGETVDSDGSGGSKDNDYKAAIEQRNDCILESGLSSSQPETSASKRRKAKGNLNLDVYKVHIHAPAPQVTTRSPRYREMHHTGETGITDNSKGSKPDHECRSRRRESLPTEESQRIVGKKDNSESLSASHDNRDFLYYDGASESGAKHMSPRDLKLNTTDPNRAAKGELADVAKGKLQQQITKGCVKVSPRSAISNSGRPKILSNIAFGTTVRPTVSRNIPESGLTKPSPRAGDPASLPQNGARQPDRTARGKYTPMDQTKKEQNTKVQSPSLRQSIWAQYRRPGQRGVQTSRVSPRTQAQSQDVHVSKSSEIPNVWSQTTNSQRQQSHETAAKQAGLEHHSFASKASRDSDYGREDTRSPDVNEERKSKITAPQRKLNTTFSDRTSRFKPMEVKSDVSNAESRIRCQAIARISSTRVKESPSSEVKKEESFTTKHKIKSPRFGGAFCGKVDSKPRARHLVKEDHTDSRPHQVSSTSKSSQCEIKHSVSDISENMRACDLSDINRDDNACKVPCRSPMFTSTSKRPSLPLHFDMFASAAGEESAEQRNQMKCLAHKRSSFSENTSRAERLEKLKREEEEAVARFHKFMFKSKSKEVYSGAARESQKLTERAQEYKQCCIQVTSVEEAKDLANSFISSAYKDFSSKMFHWNSNQRGDMIEAAADGETDQGSENGASEVKPIAGAEFENLTYGRNHSGEAHAPESHHKTVVAENEDKMTQQRNQIVKGKRFRKASASPAELRLVDSPSSANPAQHVQITNIIPNVRKIEIQPMICIPLQSSKNEAAEEENTPPGHVVVQAIKRTCNIVPLQILPDTREPETREQQLVTPLPDNTSTEPSSQYESGVVEKCPYGKAQAPEYDSLPMKYGNLSSEIISEVYAGDHSSKPGTYNSKETTTDDQSSMLADPIGTPDTESAVNDIDVDAKAQCPSKICDSLQSNATSVWSSMAHSVAAQNRTGKVSVVGSYHSNPCSTRQETVSIMTPVSRDSDHSAVSANGSEVNNLHSDCALIIRDQISECLGGYISNDDRCSTAENSDFPDHDTIDFVVDDHHGSDGHARTQTNVIEVMKRTEVKDEVHQSCGVSWNHSVSDSRSGETGDEKSRENFPGASIGVDEKVVKSSCENSDERLNAVGAPQPTGIRVPAKDESQVHSSSVSGDASSVEDVQHQQQEQTLQKKTTTPEVTAQTRRQVNNPLPKPRTRKGVDLRDSVAMNKQPNNMEKQRDSVEKQQSATIDSTTEGDKHLSSEMSSGKSTNEEARDSDQRNDIPSYCDTTSPHEAKRFTEKPRPMHIISSKYMEESKVESEDKKKSSVSVLAAKFSTNCGSPRNSRKSDIKTAEHPGRKCSSGESADETVGTSTDGDETNDAESARKKINQPSTAADTREGPATEENSHVKSGIAQRMNEYLTSVQHCNTGGSKLSNAQASSHKSDDDSNKLVHHNQSPVAYTDHKSNRHVQQTEADGRPEHVQHDQTRGHTNNITSDTSLPAEESPGRPSQESSDNTFYSAASNKPCHVDHVQFDLTSQTLGKGSVATTESTSEAHFIMREVHMPESRAERDSVAVTSEPGFVTGHSQQTDFDTSNEEQFSDVARVQVAKSLNDDHCDDTFPPDDSTAASGNSTSLSIGFDQGTKSEGEASVICDVDQSKTQENSVQIKQQTTAEKESCGAKTPYSKGKVSLSTKSRVQPTPLKTHTNSVADRELTDNVVSELQENHVTKSHHAKKAKNKSEASSDVPLQSNPETSGVFTELSATTSKSPHESQAAKTSAELHGEKRSKSTEDVDSFYSRLDMSADSFNSLFLQNAMYLEDTSGEEIEKDSSSISSSLMLRRKKSASKPVPLRPSRKSTKKKRENKREGREQHSRSLSPQKNSSPRKDSALPQHRLVQDKNQNLSANAHHDLSTGRVSSQDNQTASCSAAITSSITSSDECTIPSESPTLCLSNISDLQAVSSKDFSGDFTPTLLTDSNNSNKTTEQLAETSHVEHLEQFNPELISDEREQVILLSKNQNIRVVDSKTDDDTESDLEGETEEDMDARRRRRLLELSSYAIVDDPPSWRSKVYNTENTNSSSSSYLKESRLSQRSRDSITSLDGHENDTEVSRSARRRRSDDSTSSDLAERLAKRRAQRLGEHEEGRWSRDGSVRSVESNENGEHDEKLYSRRSRRHEGDGLTGLEGQEIWKNSRRSSRDSVMSVESADAFEEGERSTRRWSRRRESEDSNTGDQEVTSSNFRDRNWSSKDSSSCSFKSCDEGEGRPLERQARAINDHIVTESGALENTSDIAAGGRRRKIQFQDISEDSAFFESKEKSEDHGVHASISGNSNNNRAVLPQESLTSPRTARRRRIQDFIDECEEISDSKSSISNTTMEFSQTISDGTAEKVKENGDTESHNSSRWRSHVALTSSASLDTGLATASMPDSRGNTGSSDANVSGEDGEVPLAESFRDRLLRMRGVVTEDDAPTTSLQQQEKPIAPPAVTVNGTDSAGATTETPAVQETDTSQALRPPEDTEVMLTTPPASPSTKKKKKKKDKSGARKSPLNMADPESDPDSQLDNSQVGSDDGQQDGKSTRRKVEGSFVSQHASFWENHAPNPQHAPPSRQRTNIPTRYMGDLSAKINATRQKFNQTAAAASADSTTVAPSAKPKADTGEDGVAKKISRGRTDFNQLLQKFSGSESNSEKSDTDTHGASATTGGVPRKRSLVKRQAAKEVVTSSEESDASRRTPERTQSLKLPSRQGDKSSQGDSHMAAGGKVAGVGVEKSSSFRSDFMARRASQRTSEEPSVQKERSSSSSSVAVAATSSKTVAATKEETKTVSSNMSGKASAETKDDTKTTPAPVEKKDVTTLDKSLELLSRVTEELDHPEQPSSLEVKSPDPKSPVRRDSWTSIHETEDIIKKVETTISTMASRRSPDKAKSPSPGSSRFTFSEHGRAGQETSSALQKEIVSPNQTEKKQSVGETPSASQSLSPRLSPSRTPASASTHQTQPSAATSTVPLPSAASDTKPIIVSSLSLSHSSSDIQSSVSSSSATEAIETAGVRRTSSFKDVSVSRTDSMEKRKGILKRTTSLTKQDVGEGSSSFPIVDPQLAKILQQRKQLVGDVEEEEEEEEEEKKGVGSEAPRRRSRALSAAEEIEETLRYSQLKAAEKGINPEEDEALKITSVADRIYSMQTKIEEEKHAAVTPKSRSGVSTPRSRSRSGLITPTSQKSVDESHMSASSSFTSLVSATTTVTKAVTDVNSNNNSATGHQQQPPSHQPAGDSTAVSGPQLMERLTKIADASEAYQEKRQKFQYRRRNDVRHQTQPVTFEEIQAADSLETVTAFRALVRKKTLFNAFDQIKTETAHLAKQQLSQGGKKAEFPQHLVPPPKQQRRNRRLRHRTLPVTAEELNAVPENQELATEPEWVKYEESDRGGSKADSGILSGSDADSLYDQSVYHNESLRNLTLEMDIGENDPSRLSVTDKASIFKVLEEKTKSEREKEKSASGARRYIQRKKRERSQTMPITEEEVKSAAELGDTSTGTTSTTPRNSISHSRHPPSNLPQPEVVNRPRRNSKTEEEEEKVGSDDELTKLSLTEKVKLFSQLKEKEKTPAKAEAPVVRRRNRKQASRFSTQPVTTEEVEKAAAYSRISPLAMSMVKPPDPELLKTLPLKDQRQLMAQHAEMFLSQTSVRSRSGSTASLSQPSSRRASITQEEEAAKKAGESEEDKSGDKKGILKDKSLSAKDLSDIKGILKSDPSKAKSEPEVHSILKSTTEVKQEVETSLASTEPRGILKKARSEDIAAGDSGDDIKGILKHTDSEDEEHPRKPRSRSNSQPMGILKRDSSPQLGELPLERRGILKAPSQENVQEGATVIKSALRRGSMDSDPSLSNTGQLKSALKNRSKNNSESEEGQGDVSSTLASELKSALHKVAREVVDVNNSNQHVDVALSVTEQKVDHFAMSTKEVTATASTESTTRILQTSESAEVRTASSSYTTSASATSSVTTSQNTLTVPEDSDGRSGQSASEDGESSSGEILDSTPKSSKLKRKSRFSNRAARSERYKTQPPELTGDSASSTSTAATPDSAIRRKFKYEGRHRTQPITPDEMREAEATTPCSSNLTRTPGGSIADRLNQLKTSGEEEWRKRVGRKDEFVATPDAVVKLREKTGLPAQRPSSIADRLNELETSKMTWRGRVEETDVKQFTVAGKLSGTTTESPLVAKIKNHPRKEETGSKNTSPVSSPVTPTKEFIAKIPLPKEIVQDPTAKIEPQVSKVEDEKKPPVKVEVPNVGEEMEAFFAVKPIEDIKDKVKLEVDDFDNIFIEAEMILPTVRKVRPKRKTKASSHNPLKVMSQKVEIQQEYTEVSYGIAEKEFKRVKREGLAKDAGFAQAALAGLASKENFKQVELRRSDSGSSPHGQVLDPFNELMLLHVKGRRTVQVRLVEPNTRSVNEGDCYILVTPEKVIHWEGKYANVIEKAKAAEIASFIQQKKDLGCKKANEVFTVYQAKDHLGAGKVFWAALEGEKQCQACGADAEDELYESSIVKSNMVFKLEENALKPWEEYWGTIPRHEMLKKNEVIVFDYGAEFYMWQGKTVSMERRKLGLKLAKQLYEKGYDYTESILNPFSPLRTETEGGLPSKASSRPKWAIFGKVNQNMETILFREKFADWPDSSRLIGVKGHGAADTANRELLELKPYDASRMLPLNTTPVTLKLDGAHVGRGVKWVEDMQGFIKEQDVITIEVTVWHVNEYDHFKLEELSHGQFHDGDTYVVRWQYMIANANLRSLKGSAARNSLTGRERCAYFFWQGNNSTINEKGASALMTVELDEERGPQVRVLEGKEPPCFLNLFGGKMVVQIGKREDPATNTQGAWRLYCLRGDYGNEACLLEIPLCIDHLRSRSSLVLLNVKTGLVYIWHGVKSPAHVRQLCRTVVDKLKANTPLELGLHENASMIVTEVEEGEEKKEIWSAFDSRDRHAYHSLLTDTKSYRHTLRLFHMSSVNLVFEVHEQLNPSRVSDLCSPFPFLQADLYKATQPALFLVDNHHEVYLWQGWWPIGSHDTENVHTGSATARFNMDRKCAMQTVLHYCKEKNPSNPPTAYLVCAGVEPTCFTSLFPYWIVDTVVRDMALEEGKAPDYMEKVSDILHRLTETRYTLAELQERPLPDGVDPLKLESYLNDAEFEEILEMNREEFYSQPAWKQRDMKKLVGLF